MQTGKKVASLKKRREASVQGAEEGCEEGWVIR